MFKLQISIFLEHNYSSFQLKKLLISRTSASFYSVVHSHRQHLLMGTGHILKENSSPPSLHLHRQQQLCLQSPTPQTVFTVKQVKVLLELLLVLFGLTEALFVPLFQFHWNDHFPLLPSTVCITLLSLLQNTKRSYLL